MATPVLDDIKRAYRLAWWALLLRGVFAVFIGVFIWMKPLDSIAVFALLIAFWALFAGTVDVVHAFQLKPMLSNWWVMLLTGLIGIGFGIAALMYYPGLALSFAVVWVAWWLMLTGITGIYGGITLRKLGLDWLWTTIFGAISVLAGVFALASPPATLGAIMSLISIFAVIAGIVLIVGAVKIRSIAHP